MNTTSLEQLKARAYDILASIQQLQMELRNVNAEIEKQIKASDNHSKPMIT